MIQPINFSYDNNFYCYCSIAEELHGIFTQFKSYEQLSKYQRLLKKHTETVKVNARGAENLEKAKALCRNYISQNGGKLFEEISPELCIARLTLISACLPIFPTHLAWLVDLGALCKSARFCACDGMKVALQLEFDYFDPHEPPIILAMDELQRLAPPAPSVPKS